MRYIEIKDWQKQPSIARIVRATFPDYKRKTVYLQPDTSVTLMDLNWSGGSRSQYRTCTIDGNPIGSADKYSAFAPWNNPAEGMTLPIPSGMVAVRGGHFCGKVSLLTLHINPENMPLYLPKPVVALSPADIEARQADIPRAV